jgi:hypothetical protein
MYYFQVYTVIRLKRHRVVNRPSLSTEPLLKSFFQYDQKKVKESWWIVKPNSSHSLFNNFPSQDCIGIGQTQYIDPTGQITDINLRFGRSYFASDKLLTVKI